MQSISRTSDLPEVRNRWKWHWRGNFGSLFCLTEKKERTPRSCGNIPNDTAVGHFTAPLRGIVPSARNR
jgi:hypothetical protein